MAKVCSHCKARMMHMADIVVERERMGSRMSEHPAVALNGIPPANLLTHEIARHPINHGRDSPGRCPWYPEHIALKVSWLTPIRCRIRPFLNEYAVRNEDSSRSFPPSPGV